MALSLFLAGLSREDGRLLTAGVLSSLVVGGLVHRRSQGRRGARNDDPLVVSPAEQETKAWVKASSPRLYLRQRETVLGMQFSRSSWTADRDSWERNRGTRGTRGARPGEILRDLMRSLTGKVEPTILTTGSNQTVRSGWIYVERGRVRGRFTSDVAERTSLWDLLPEILPEQYDDQGEALLIDWFHEHPLVEFYDFNDWRVFRYFDLQIDPASSVESFLAAVDEQEEIVISRDESLDADLARLLPTKRTLLMNDAWWRERLRVGDELRLPTAAR